MNWEKIAPWNWFKKRAPASISDATPTTGGVVIPLRPGVDIVDEGMRYAINVELPGVEATDVSIEVEGRTLTLRAEKRQEREAEGEGYRITEHAYGAFQRIFALPGDADGDRAEAKLKKGVLKLQIPKHSAPVSRGRSIKIAAR